MYVCKRSNCSSADLLCTIYTIYLLFVHGNMHVHVRTHVQAARVTNACNKLIATGPEVRARPLQYVSTSQIELDSYVNLTQAVRMRVG